MNGTVSLDSRFLELISFLYSKIVVSKQLIEGYERCINNEELRNFKDENYQKLQVEKEFIEDSERFIEFIRGEKKDTLLTAPKTSLLGDIPLHEFLSSISKYFPGVATEKFWCGLYIAGRKDTIQEVQKKLPLIAVLLSMQGPVNVREGDNECPF